MVRRQFNISSFCKEDARIRLCMYFFKVAGWGLTTVNGEASPALKVADVPFINVETCISTIPISFREYITGDKFCAGYTNGMKTLSVLCVKIIDFDLKFD